MFIWFRNRFYRDDEKRWLNRWSSSQFCYWLGLEWWHLGSFGMSWEPERNQSLSGNDRKTANQRIERAFDCLALFFSFCDRVVSNVRLTVKITFDWFHQLLVIIPRSEIRWKLNANNAEHMHKPRPKAQRTSSTAPSLPVVIEWHSFQTKTFLKCNIS